MKLSVTRLRRIIDEATVDAYTESEQRVGFLTMIEERLAVPFTICVLGVEASVERVDMNSAEEIVAICRRGRARQAIPILELSLTNPPPKGAEWIEAYRRWIKGA